jgi:hypothetical protein
MQRITFLCILLIIFALYQLGIGIAESVVFVKIYDPWHKTKKTECEDGEFIIITISMCFNIICSFLTMFLVQAILHRIEMVYFIAQSYCTCRTLLTLLNIMFAATIGSCSNTHTIIMIEMVHSLIWTLIVGIYAIHSFIECCCSVDEELLPD